MSVIVGVCTMKLYLPGVLSLKEKRSRLQPLLNGLRRTYAVAAAEVDEQDAWQTACVAVAALSNETAQVYRVLQSCVQWVQTEAREVDMLEWHVELR